jgi:CRP-like cAMP-binding protein
MALNDDISLLSKVPLFDGFNDEMLRLVAFGSERRTITRNKPLFHEGAVADSAFVVSSGRFNLLSRDRKGKLVSVGNASPGDLLGELAIVSASKRKITAMATEDSEVIRINRPMFRRMMEEYPEIADMLRVRIKQNLSSLLRQINNLAPHFEDPATRSE